MKKRIISLAALAVLVIFCLASVKTEAKGITKKLTSVERTYYSTICRNYYKDEVTATIIDLGYIQRVGQINASLNGMFVADFKAITGDSNNPMLMMDIVVSDPRVLACDEFDLYTYTLGVNEFLTELNNYGYFDGKAYRDSVVPNLYHYMFRGAPAWLCYNENAVVYVDHATVNDQDIPVGINFIIKPDSSLYFKSANIYAPGVSLSFGGIDYDTTVAEFSLYGSDIGFCFDYLGQPWANGATDFESVRGIAEANWNNLKSQSVLLVDGQPVYIDQNIHEYMYSDEYLNNKCYVYMHFTGVNYQYAKEILFLCGGQIFKLK